MIAYRYTHTHTLGTTGYFTCVPDGIKDLADIFSCINAAPLDSFIRRYALQQIGSLPLSDTLKAFKKFLPGMPLPLFFLALEVAKVFPDLANGLQEILAELPNRQIAFEDIACNSSLVYLRSREILQEEKDWNKVFTANIQNHRFPESPEQLKFPHLYVQATAGWADLSGQIVVENAFSIPASAIRHDMANRGVGFDSIGSVAPIGAAEEDNINLLDHLAGLAQERLSSLGVLAGEMKRHTASLSPVAVLCPWNIKMRVTNGRNSFTLDGKGTTYGRGLNQSRAKVSCLMEMVERSTVYFSVEHNEVLDRLQHTPIIKAKRSQLLENNKQALNLVAFPLDAPYRDEPLHWLAGQSASGQTVYVPAQMAGLFCNLEEIDLFEALGSTGIATHSTIESAKTAALLEIIERDAESNSPFSKSSCFTLTSSDPFVGKLLEAYKSMGINVQFQDLTGSCGVPAYQCFVVSRKGAVARGYGAGLSARKAILSAITETPYAFPGEASGPCLRNIPEYSLEDLPDLSTGSVMGDLHLLEQVFVSNGRMPVYVDMTHKDLKFPVVRALVENMELTSESDEFRKPSLSLWRNYLKLFGVV